jgi:hypothetical protein
MVLESSFYDLQIKSSVSSRFDSARGRRLFDTTGTSIYRTSQAKNKKLIQKPNIQAQKYQQNFHESNTSPYEKSSKAASNTIGKNN